MLELGVFLSNILFHGDGLGPEIPARLDVVCTELLGVSRALVIDWIREGKITVNGKVAKPALKVGDTDRIEWSELTPRSQAAPFAVTESPVIVFEDDAIIVLNKPIYWTVHEVHQGQKGPFLTDWLLSHDGPTFTAFNSRRPGIVHRLDQMTEGLMVVAKNEVILEALKEQFKERLVDKRYYAAVRGNVLSEEMVIDQPIIRSPKTRKKMIVAPDGKPALSMVKVVRRFQSKTLLEVSPKTGRTHQIRVHLDFVGHPVIGDPVYGKGPGPKDGQRLQAFYLGFRHPVSGEDVSFSIPLSKRMGV